jgi:hypothetical protein
MPSSRRSRARCSMALQQAMASSCSSCAPSKASRFRGVRCSACSHRIAKRSVPPSSRWCVSRQRPGTRCRSTLAGKWIVIAGARTRVHLFVAVLGYSRRIFVRASLSQKQHDWREGLAGAYRTFGGVTQRILIDRAGALRPRRRSRHAHRACASGIHCVLQRLGYRSLGVSTVSRTQRQDRVGRWLHKAKCDRRSRVRELRCSRGSSGLLANSRGKPARPRHDARAAARSLRA